MEPETIQVDDAVLAKPEEGRGLMLRLVASVAVLGALVAVTLGVTGRQTSNVFSNVSTGLCCAGTSNLSSNSSSNSNGSGVLDVPATVADAPAPTQPVARPAAATAASGKFDIGSPQGHIERKVDASYVVPHGAFERSFSAVVAAGTALGGYLVSSDTHPDQSGRVVSGTLVLKVPTVKLSDLLGGLSSDFKPSSVNFNSTDHTAEYVDGAARLRIAKVKQVALERALAQASTPADIATLSGDVLAAQQTVETFQGALNVLDEQTAMATAQISFREADTVTVAPAPPSAIDSSARTGWDNDKAILGGALLVGLTLLPIVVLILLIAVPVYLVARRVRRVVAPTPQATV